MAHSACLLFDSFFISFSSSYNRKITSVPYAVVDAVQVVSNFIPTGWKNSSLPSSWNHLGVSSVDMLMQTLILN